jgi:hypothetical protein
MHAHYNYRVAALKLQALHPSDREWILSQLASAKRKVLEDLLEELTSLGLIVSTKSTSEFSYFPVAKLELNRETFAFINQTDVKLVWSSMAALPQRIQAMVLHAAQWSWSAQIWNKFESHERSSLSVLISELADIKPAVMHCVLDIFAVSLQAGLVSELGAYTHDQMSAPPKLEV